jgi:hypothetical protein
VPSAECSELSTRYHVSSLAAIAPRIAVPMMYRIPTIDNAEKDTMDFPVLLNGLFARVLL